MSNIPGPDQYPGYGVPPLRSQRTNGMAIAGFVLSFFCSLLGLIFSAVAMSQISKTGEGGRGLAIAGLVISGVSILLFVLFFGALFSAFDG